MTAESPGIILHHFDQSPFGEKIRVIFGFKNIGLAVGSRLSHSAPA
jgi:hypothetical protein